MKIIKASRFSEWIAEDSKSGGLNKPPRKGMKSNGGQTMYYPPLCCIQCYISTPRNVLTQGLFIDRFCSRHADKLHNWRIVSNYCNSNKMLVRPRFCSIVNPKVRLCIFYLRNPKMDTWMESPFLIIFIIPQKKNQEIYLNILE